MGRLTGAVLGVPAEQRDAPQACQPHKGIDDPGENGHLAAKEKGNGVKADSPTPPQFSAPTITRISAILSTIMFNLL